MSNGGFSQTANCPYFWCCKLILHKEGLGVLYTRERPSHSPSNCWVKDSGRVCILEKLNDTVYQVYSTDRMLACESTLANDDDMEAPVHALIRFFFSLDLIAAGQWITIHCITVPHSLSLTVKAVFRCLNIFLQACYDRKNRCSIRSMTRMHLVLR